jgi:hypothetical protein
MVIATEVAVGADIEETEAALSGIAGFDDDVALRYLLLHSQV